MQFLKQLAKDDLTRRLAQGKLALRIGPYIYNIQTNLASVAAGLATLYGDFALAEPEEFIDFNIAMLREGLLNRFRDEAEFRFDHISPFQAIPCGQAYAFLEWGMNWCISVQCNEYLKLHAAVVSRDKTAIVMPGVPGAGKSTLCAALGLSGWRILSDEHAMIPLNTNEVVPICRPVSLKNESIDAISSFSSRAIFGPVSEKTHKGVVVHMKADIHPDCHDPRNLEAKAMIFPRYTRDEPQRLSRRQRTDSFILAAYHSFNYSLLCEAGFDAMKMLINRVECYDLVYHDLDWATQTVSGLPEVSVDQ
jgi:HprK-related kinase A